MTTISATTISDTGTVQTLNAVSASDEFANNGKCWYEVKNSGAGSDTVVIATGAIIKGKAIADGGGVVANDGVPVKFGPFDPSIYNNASGKVVVTHSQTTGVTAALFALP